MKLATYKDGSRDGHLVVVSHDLSTAHYASGIASRLQQVLDDWNFLSPQLEDLSITLNQGRARHAFAFDPRLCLAPLPRAYRHVQARAGASADAPPQLQHRSGDGLGAAGDFIEAIGSEPNGCTLQVALLSGDVAARSSVERAAEGVRLLMLCADIGPGAGVPRTLFAPLAVTPDELGPGAWRGGRARLKLRWQHHGPAPHDEAPGAAWPVGEVLAALAATGPVGAGCIVATGAIGHAAVPAGGWSVEALGEDGLSVFGRIAPAAPVVLPSGVVEGVE